MKPASSSLSRLLILALLSAAAATPPARADEDGAYLDPPYPRTAGPVRGEFRAADELPRPERERTTRRLPSKSDTAALIALQTPVRNQSARGTCSIFSSTAMLESHLIREGYFAQDADFSEEWLQYVVMTTKEADLSGKVNGGSWTYYNFEMFKKFGTAEEALLEYIGETWEALASSPLAQLRCAVLAGLDLNRCLLGHRSPKLLRATEAQLTTPGGPLYDPDFLAVRDRASEVRLDYTAGIVSTNSHRVTSLDAVKGLLAKGIPVALDVDFYYGAWNHRKATELGIGRDMNAWAAGIVGYPEYGSADLVNTRKEPAGHSVVLVGYDDNAVIETEVLMEDGSTGHFTYKGVFYFKNSWGTASFGVSTEIDGVTYPGYGAITQQYAIEHGEFFQLRLN